MLTLYSWQDEDAIWLAQSDRLLASDCGTGKTLIAVEAAKRSARGPVLVIAPRLTKEWWAEAIREQEAGYVGICGRAGRDIPWEAIRNWRDKMPLAWVVVHPEAVRLAIQDLLRVPWDTVIVDEAHRFKNRDAKQTRALWKLQPRRKMLLTATPYGKSPADLWALLHYLAPQSYRSYWKFFDKYVSYVQPPGQQFKIVQGPRDLEGLAKEIAPLYRKRRKEDLLDLPEILYTDLPVSINGEQEKLYTQLVKDAYAELVGDDGKPREIILENALVRILRLQQCALDPSLLAADLPMYPTGVPAKVEWLTDWLEDNPEEPVIITSRYRRFVEKWLRDIAPDSCIVGGMSTKSVQVALKYFQKYGVLVGTLDAIKEGLNLQRASTMIIMDGSYSTVAEYQLSQRIHRVGQTRKCQVIHLVGKLEKAKKWTADKLMRDSVKKSFTEAELVDSFIRDLQRR